MFLGGADQSAELRAPSIRGALRWWWRTMHAERDPKRLLELEGGIFGSSAGTGQVSGVGVRLIPLEFEALKGDLPDHPVTVQSKGQMRRFNVLNYLAFGPVQYDKEKRRPVMSRSYLQAGGRFDIVLTFRDKAIKQEILATMSLLATLGGLGAR